jgi:hypothetical protein
MYLPLEPYITKQDTRWRLAIPSRVRLVAYLLYITQGMTYLPISYLIGIGKMTVCMSRRPGRGLQGQMLAMSSQIQITFIER